MDEGGEIKKEKRHEFKKTGIYLLRFLMLSSKYLLGLVIVSEL